MVGLVARTFVAVMVFAALGPLVFLSGWIVVTRQCPMPVRRARVDWGCPSCNVWSTVTVTRIGKALFHKKALKSSHHRLSPACRASRNDLITLCLSDVMV